MTIKTFKACFIEKLRGEYDIEEIECFFLICLEYIEHKKRFDLMLNPELEVSDLKKWEEVLNQLKEHRPIQYIFEKTFFYGLPFIIREGVLIPRPETEELVEWILSSVPKGKSLRVLDIGTGSGCIAISLAKNLPLASVYALDVSESALEIAKQNASKNNVDITFLKKDILIEAQLLDQFDVIVSNPPYVRNLEKIEIQKNVLNYEPHLALFVSDDKALIFYEKIASLADNNLQSEGMLFFEINQYLGKETLALFEGLSFKSVELRRDMMQNDRMIRAIKK